MIPDARGEQQKWESKIVYDSRTKGRTAIVGIKDVVRFQKQGWNRGSGNQRQCMIPKTGVETRKWESKAWYDSQTKGRNA